MACLIDENLLLSPIRSSKLFWSHSKAGFTHYLCDPLHAHTDVKHILALGAY